MAGCFRLCRNRPCSKQFHKPANSAEGIFRQHQRRTDFLHHHRARRTAGLDSRLSTVGRFVRQTDNLKYMIAVALLDGDLYPEQYTTERINRADVQTLLRKVVVCPQVAYTARIPQEQVAKVTITLAGNRTVQKEKTDYEGFYKRPMTWERVTEKFNRLSAPFADADLQREIVSAVENLEKIQVAELVNLLGRVRGAEAKQAAM